MLETARDLIHVICSVRAQPASQKLLNPFDFYRNLRVTNPSNYIHDLSYLRLSPEVWSL